MWLHIHLPHEEVPSDPTEVIETSNDKKEKSKLKAYFKANEEGLPNARDTLYRNFPEKCVLYH